MKARQPIQINIKSFFKSIKFTIVGNWCKQMEGKLNLNYQKKKNDDTEQKLRREDGTVQSFYSKRQRTHRGESN